MVGAELRLQALHERYHASLPNKRASVDLAWCAYRADRLDPERQESLMRLVHRLAGSAPSYGYGEIGEIAAKADVLMEQFRQTDTPEPVGHAGLDGLDPLIALLLQALDQAAASPARTHEAIADAQS
ncbi:Hpt domain-containing protein [Dokdonella sp.]|uniref:Hpt domain-containing protein n=1 Tax=Dokdonella sp. TaxID=2291710 RepID=UPI003C45B1D4